MARFVFHVRFTPVGGGDSTAWSSSTTTQAGQAGVIGLSALFLEKLCDCYLVSSGFTTRKATTHGVHRPTAHIANMFSDLVDATDVITHRDGENPAAGLQQLWVDPVAEKGNSDNSSHLLETNRWG